MTTNRNMHPKNDDPSPEYMSTVSVLLQAYAHLAKQGLADLQEGVYGGKWINACLLQYKDTPRSKGMWRRIAYRDFLEALRLLDIPPCLALHTMKKLLMRQEMASGQLALLLDATSDLLGAPSELQEADEWEVGEVYAESPLCSASSPHEPRAWLKQAYLEFRGVLEVLGVNPDRVQSVLEAMSRGDSTRADHRPEGK